MEVTGSVADEILRFLSSATSGGVVAADQDYMAEGLINSLQALELVVHIEQRFGIEVGVDDLDIENFRTAGRIAEFVQRKRGAGSETADG